MRAQPGAERTMMVSFEGDRLAAENLARAYARVVLLRPRRRPPPPQEPPGRPGQAQGVER
jgi:hypothetical protein